MKQIKIKVYPDARPTCMENCSLAGICANHGSAANLCIENGMTPKMFTENGKFFCQQVETKEAGALYLNKVDGVLELRREDEFDARVH